MNLSHLYFTFKRTITQSKRYNLSIDLQDEVDALSDINVNSLHSVFSQSCIIKEYIPEKEKNRNVFKVAFSQKG